MKRIMWQINLNLKFNTLLHVCAPGLFSHCLPSPFPVIIKLSAQKVTNSVQTHKCQHIFDVTSICHFHLSVFLQLRQGEPTTDTKTTFLAINVLLLSFSILTISYLFSESWFYSHKGILIFTQQKRKHAVSPTSVLKDAAKPHKLE